MELDWIDDILALEQTRNFTRAADLRATTQPAYSRRLQRLEDWIGAELVRRDTRPISFTDAGLEFLQRAKRLRADILDAKRASSSAQSHFDKPYRVYTTNTIAISFLPGWMAAASIPNLSIIVASVTGCLEALRTGKCETALLPDFIDLGDTPRHQTVIAQDCLRLYALPSVAAQLTRRDKGLEGPFLLYSPTTYYGQAVAALLSRNKLSLPTAPICESASAEALASMAKKGLGAAWIPDSLAETPLTPCAIGTKLCQPYKILALSPKRL
jgi:LysR family transcriptional regulator, hypochlorite-specific transcription factor HypT